MDNMTGETGDSDGKEAEATDGNETRDEDVARRTRETEKGRIND